jgi:hypothetical protein
LPAGREITVIIAHSGSTLGPDVVFEAAQVPAYQTSKF